MSEIVVYKEQLHLDSEFTEFEVASEAFKILHVDEQHGEPTIWFETLRRPLVKQKVKFCIIGTGQYVPNNCSYVGTCKCGPYVWHVYQNLERKK